MSVDAIAGQIIDKVQTDTCKELNALKNDTDVTAGEVLSATVQIADNQNLASAAINADTKDLETKTRAANIKV